MAERYGLKYYAEFRNTRGHDYRLEVWRRGYTRGAKEIGTLCACQLDIQGGMGDIISPIIKTQLRFSLVDAWDIEETEAAKYGDWQEFFTPDSTLYRVALKDIEAETTIWTGYITPDSWLEDLDYRGAVTITARDNIGHLQDFPFEATGDATPDENGLVQIQWIISQALKVVDFPMGYVTEGPSAGVQSNIPETEDEEPITNGYVNVSLFKDMNWYEVLEKTLESIGYVLRYVGNNRYACSTLRGMPLMGNWRTAVGTQEMEFYGGTLELDPAVKKIEEEQDYKMEKEVSLPVFDGLVFSSTYGTYRCKTDGNPLPGGGTYNIPEHDAKYKANTNSGWTGWEVGSGMLDPETEQPDVFLVRDEGTDGWKKYAFIACNQQPGAGGTSIYADYRIKTRTAGVRITFQFTPNALTMNNNAGSEYGKMQKPKYTLANIKYYLFYTNGQVTKWWNGAGWVNAPYLISVDYDSANKEETDFVIDLIENPSITGGGDIVIRFGQITYNMSYDGGYGCYARVANILVEMKAQAVLKSNKVTTINNDKYNVQLTRRPLFGVLSLEMGFVKPLNYLAGIFNYPDGSSYPQLMDYRFRMTDTHVLVPFPVLVHQQILCYYYGAARVLNGSCAPVAKAPFDFGKLCTYKGFTYLLQGGTLDLFQGVINGAVLREFVRFEDLWDPDEPPQYEEDVTYNG